MTGENAKLKRENAPTLIPNPGSVRIGQEKVLVEVLRLIDNETGETFSPESDCAMRELPAPDKQLPEAILLDGA